MTIARTVLITGCSSGIGKATARRLARAGWTVYATARRRAELADLEAEGCHPLALDVTDLASMTAAGRAIAAAHGAVGVLINNAGYSQSGAFEAVPIDRVRAQFETNLFGPIQLAQLVLPAMRRQGFGKIVNLSSLGGKLVFPGGAYYHATKHALEAVSDALRFEVRGFGIDVILIEPGLIVTNFGETADRTTAAVQSDDDPYGRFHASLRRSMANAYQGPLAKLLGGGPDDVAKVIERAISAKRPPTRRLVTPSAYLSLGQRKLVTDRVWDRMMSTQFSRPKR
jgi:NAD(P)-dependent dehydrogenase (short-subunit alcohol dehydrogenase family)